MRWDCWQGEMKGEWSSTEQQVGPYTLYDLIHFCNAHLYSVAIYYPAQLCVLLCVSLSGQGKEQECMISRSRKKRCACESHAGRKHCSDECWRTVQEIYGVSGGNGDRLPSLNAWNYSVFLLHLLNVRRCLPDSTSALLVLAQPSPTSAPTTSFLWSVFVVHAAPDDGPLRISLWMKDKNLSLSAREDSFCSLLPRRPVLHTGIKLISELLFYFLKIEKGQRLKETQRSTEASRPQGRNRTSINLF